MRVFTVTGAFSAFKLAGVNGEAPVPALPQVESDVLARHFEGGLVLFLIGE